VNKGMKRKGQSPYPMTLARRTSENSILLGTWVNRAHRPGPMGQKRKRKGTKRRASAPSRL
jgi:hypothetical protein